MMVLKRLWTGVLRKRTSGRNMNEDSNPHFRGKRLRKRTNILRETGLGFGGLFL